MKKEEKKKENEDILEGSGLKSGIKHKDLDFDFGIDNSDYDVEIDALHCDFLSYQKLDLEGWIWEFIRRNSGYQALYTKFIQLSSKCKSIDFCEYTNYAVLLIEGQGRKVFLPDNKRNVNFDTLFEIITGLGNYSLNFNQLFKSEKVHPLHFSLIRLEKNLYFGLPNPDMPYRVFGLEKPIINGATPIKFITGEFIELGKMSDNFDKGCSRILNETLLHKNLNDTLFVSISRGAGVEEVEQALKRILKNYIVPKKIRMRPKEWRYYLIVFDLKKKNKSISEIINLLINAFPHNKNIFDEKNINNYYKNALVLIDGGYKEFLTYSK